MHTFLLLTHTPCFSSSDLSLVVDVEIRWGFHLVVIDGH